MGFEVFGKRKRNIVPRKPRCQSYRLACDGPVHGVIVLSHVNATCPSEDSALAGDIGRARNAAADQWAMPANSMGPKRPLPACMA